jgi:hypothetical protein
MASPRNRSLKVPVLKSLVQSRVKVAALQDCARTSVPRMEPKRIIVLEGNTGGQLFDSSGYAAAHRTLPFGTAGQRPW